jgi:hypothetical protein
MFLAIITTASAHIPATVRYTVVTTQSETEVGRIGTILLALAFCVVFGKFVEDRYRANYE